MTSDIAVVLIANPAVSRNMLQRPVMPSSLPLFPLPLLKTSGFIRVVSADGFIGAAFEFSCRFICMRDFRLLLVVVDPITRHHFGYWSVS